jgi:archaellum component FlaC
MEEGKKSIKAIDNELKRLHETVKLMIEYPDRITGDLLVADVYGNIERFHRLLEDIARRHNGLEY